ncbi:DUF4381 domain-containing protein [Alteromonas sp. ALT199]|uniref:DUF4381 domain-containing protein n=1 Tax=unclassified Alteromonas TaxID=2614992 RepID=UPI001BEC2CCA|nr:DUF4381 domain-containing protein [Alteromonas sp. ALT199]MBT3136113.1 DUF4381 domain-containing protein [Alteromonas sp. ALT199]
MQSINLSNHFFSSFLSRFAQSMPSGNQMPMPPQQQDPLAQLRDIHVPTEVNIWPLDWGWWALIAVALLVLFGLYKAITAHIRHNKARKQALALLESISVQQSNWPVALNSVLKRTAMSYYSTQQVAGLYGKQWQAFLTSALKNGDKKLESDLALLVSNVYQATPNPRDFETCKGAVKNWLLKAKLPKNKQAVNGLSPENAKELHHA